MAREISFRGTKLQIIKQMADWLEDLDTESWQIEILVRQLDD